VSAGCVFGAEPEWSCDIVLFYPLYDLLKNWIINDKLKLISGDGCFSKLGLEEGFIGIKGDSEG
jgi:hypothetical protein